MLPNILYDFRELLKIAGYVILTALVVFLIGPVVLTLVLIILFSIVNIVVFTLILSYKAIHLVAPKGT